LGRSTVVLRGHRDARPPSELDEVRFGSVGGSLP
jgi:hypothetical protein